MSPMNELSPTPRNEGSSSTVRGLNNSDIIAIVGILASVTATVFGAWFLKKLRKTFSQPEANELGSTTPGGRGANVNHSPSHYPLPASNSPLQDPELPLPPTAQTSGTAITTPAPVVDGAASHQRTFPGHPLEITVNGPKRAHTWAAGKTL